MEIEFIQSLDDNFPIDELVLLVDDQLKSYGVNKSLDDMRNGILNALKPESRGVFIILKNDSEPIGFGFGNICSGLETAADYFWLNELFIQKQFRNRGYASKLLRAIEKWAIAEQVKYLACSTGIENTIAQSLYKKNGFELNKTIWVDKELP
jgi:GNAT superfamily N-acetyltransferase